MADDMTQSPLNLSSKEDLKGLKVVFTGGLKHHNRDETYELARQLHTTPTMSISHQSDLLVIGKNPGDDKLSFAEEQDVPQITQEQFYELLKDEYKIDPLVFLASQSAVDADHSAYEDLDELVDVAVRNLLKELIDGTEVEERSIDETTSISVDLDPSLQPVIDTYVDADTSNLGSTDHFVEEALCLELGLGDETTSVELSAGLVEIADGVAREIDEYDSVEEYIQAVVENDLRSRI